MHRILGSILFTVKNNVITPLLRGWPSPHLSGKSILDPPLRTLNESKMTKTIVRKLINLFQICICFEQVNAFK